jgi:hypothetical protein
MLSLMKTWIGQMLRERRDESMLTLASRNININGFWSKSVRNC